MYSVLSAEYIKGSAWASRPKPWVARLTALDTRWGFTREFIKGVSDYTHVNGKRGGRGIYIYFAMPPGVYEVYYPISWKHDRRYFARVDEKGNITEITRDEVIECLKNASSE
jgi:hypothetical protein